jgi:hypothetical protein
MEEVKKSVNPIVYKSASVRNLPVPVQSVLQPAACPTWIQRTLLLKLQRRKNITVPWGNWPRPNQIVPYNWRGCSRRFLTWPTA